MKLFTDLLLSVVIAVSVPTGPVWAVAKPDFKDHQAVLASLKILLEQCGADSHCTEECRSIIESMEKYKEPHPRNQSLRRNRWEACRKAQPVAKAAPESISTPAATFDRNRILIGGVQLGGKLEDAAGRISSMAADGYFKQEKRERGTGTFRWQDPTEREAMPDIVNNFEAWITDKDQRIHIWLEAAGNGAIYKIEFKQRGEIEPVAAKQRLIERFGAPTKTTKSYLTWGCQDGQLDVCVKATASKYLLHIFAQDVSIKNEWLSVYRDKVAEARAVD
jgi:hypothetical protein